jgi:hypothetical protein
MEPEGVADCQAGGGEEARSAGGRRLQVGAGARARASGGLARLHLAARCVGLHHLGRVLLGHLLGGRRGRRGGASSGRGGGPASRAASAQHSRCCCRRRHGQLLQPAARSLRGPLSACCAQPACPPPTSRTRRPPTSSAMSSLHAALAAKMLPTMTPIAIASCSALWACGRVRESARRGEGRGEAVGAARARLRSGAWRAARTGGLPRSPCAGARGGHPLVCHQTAPVPPPRQPLARAHRREQGRLADAVQHGLRVQQPVVPPQLVLQRQLRRGGGRVQMPACQARRGSAAARRRGAAYRSPAAARARAALRRSGRGCARARGDVGRLGRPRPRCRARGVLPLPVHPRAHLLLGFGRKLHRATAPSPLRQALARHAAREDPQALAQRHGGAGGLPGGAGPAAAGGG